MSGEQPIPDHLICPMTERILVLAGPDMDLVGIIVCALKAGKCWVQYQKNGETLHSFIDQMPSPSP
jgi:hypothetical protein